MENKWINVNIALNYMGRDAVKFIGISQSNSVLEKAWNYWGPIQYPIDTPTWLELVEAERLAMLDSFKQESTRSLRFICQRRITKAYGADSFNDEIATRTRGDSTPEQDAERERLRAKYREIKATLLSQSTERELLSIDLDANSLWASPSQDA